MAYFVDFLWNKTTCKVIYVWYCLISYKWLCQTFYYKNREQKDMHTMYLIKMLPLSAYKLILYNNCKHRSVSRLFYVWRDRRSGITSIYNLACLCHALRLLYYEHTVCQNDFCVNLIIYPEKDTQKLSANTKRNHLSKSISITYEYTLSRKVRTIKVAFLWQNEKHNKFG